MNYIPLEQCQSRHIYNLQSRNLLVGVFDADAQGFIGIREKFGNRYLFTEYHYDTGSPHGTVRPFEDCGELDHRIRLWERYPGSICFYCGIPVEWQWQNSNDPALRRSWWHETATDCDDLIPMSMGTYTPLFNALEESQRSCGIWEED